MSELWGSWPFEPERRGSIALPGATVGASIRPPSGGDPSFDVGGYLGLLRRFLELRGKTGMRQGARGPAFPTSIGVGSGRTGIGISGVPELSAGIGAEGELTGPRVDLPLGSLDVGIGTPFGGFSMQQAVRFGSRSLRDALKALLSPPRKPIP